MDNKPSISVAKMQGIQNEYFQRDLEWSLRPIFYGLRVFGVDLDVNQPASIYRPYAFITLEMFLFIFSSCSGFLMIKAFRLHDPDTPSFLFYLILMIVSTIFFNALYFTTLMVTTRLRWRRLWKKAKEVERLCQLPASFYKRLRNAVTVGIIAFGLLVTAINSLSTFRLKFTGHELFY